MQLHLLDKRHVVLYNLFVQCEKVGLQKILVIVPCELRHVNLVHLFELGFKTA